MYHQMMSIIFQRGLNNSLEGLLFPHTGLRNFKIRVFASTGVSLWLRAVHQTATWKHLSKPFIRPGWPVLRKLWHIETTPFKKFMHDKLKKMKKAHSRTWLSNVHSETQKATETNANVVRSRSERFLLSLVIVDAIADSFPRVLLVPNVVLHS